MEYPSLNESLKREFIGLIYESSQNTYKFLENLLEWARSQSGSIEYNPSVTDIKKLADENIELLQSVAKKKNIQLTSGIAENLTIHTDSDLIKTVMRNLISNAIKFTPENGKVSIFAKCITNQEGKIALKVSVADTGVGIAPEQQEELFKLNKNHSTKGTKGESGSGLGLILCKEFTEKCGGKIWAESKVGKGSVFHITLPTKPLDSKPSVSE